MTNGKVSASLCVQHGNCRDSFCQRCQDILENDQLRADLATVTAERDGLCESFDRTIDREDSLRRELDETRHCLEHALRCERTARAELAKAEARVKELEQALRLGRSDLGGLRG